MIQHEQNATTFDSLYAHFDEFIEFLHTHPSWAHQLYAAKERFIRSKDRNFYSTDFFSLYDESRREGRNQIAFYYSSHFHEFVRTHYPKFIQVPEITRFFDACFEIQRPYQNLFQETADEIGLNTLFASSLDGPPILLKVVKYYPSYAPAKPHYDGSTFSLFLDSTDNQSLLISPYKPSYTTNDFLPVPGRFSRGESPHSILLIPGTLLLEFAIYPTPHIVGRSGKTRYATIAFCMRPDYRPEKYEFSPLPDFKH